MDFPCVLKKRKGVSNNNCQLKRLFMKNAQRNRQLFIQSISFPILASKFLMLAEARGFLIRKSLSFALGLGGLKIQHDKS